MVLIETLADGPTTAGATSQLLASPTKMIWQWQRFLVKPENGRKSRSANVDPNADPNAGRLHKIRISGMAMHKNNTSNLVDIGINELWRRMSHMNEIQSAARPVAGMIASMHHKGMKRHRRSTVHQKHQTMPPLSKIQIKSMQTSVSRVPLPVTHRLEMLTMG